MQLAGASPYGSLNRFGVLKWLCVVRVGSQNALPGVYRNSWTRYHLKMSTVLLSHPALDELLVRLGWRRCPGVGNHRWEAAALFSGMQSELWL